MTLIPSHLQPHLGHAQGVMLEMYQANWEGRPREEWVVNWFKASEVEQMAAGEPTPPARLVGQAIDAWLQHEGEGEEAEGAAGE